MEVTPAYVPASATTLRPFIGRSCTRWSSIKFDCVALRDSTIVACPETWTSSVTPPTAIEKSRRTLAPDVTSTFR